MDCINRLTEKLDNYEGINWGNVEDVHTNLWNDLANLRNIKPEEKSNLLNGWKYKSDFEYTEEKHLNGQKSFHLMTWEQSFVLTMLFSHYR